MQKNKQYSHGFKFSTKCREVLSPFLVYIKFHMIPASVLMTEIHPLGLVPYK